jgi:hypothetical protein
MVGESRTTKEHVASVRRSNFPVTGGYRRFGQRVFPTILCTQTERRDACLKSSGSRRLALKVGLVGEFDDIL